MSNEIEVKLVLDSTQLNGGFDTPEFGDAVEQVFHDRSSFVADLTGLMNVVPAEDIADYVFDSYSFDSNVESLVANYIENSDLYYLPDTVSELQDEIGEYDFMQMQDDLNRDEEAIDDLKDRVDTIEDKLGMDVADEDVYDSIRDLTSRVEKLEEINKRLFHLIHNIQGVPLT
tara:strand:+ start:3199 stop:3717 length:519 start_codon:yes stop_codon:yes gene_type:complete